MSTELQEIFPDFSKDLLEAIDDAGVFHEFKAGATLIRTGQYIKSTLLVTHGKLKVYREDDDGNEFFMYYLEYYNITNMKFLSNKESKNFLI